MLSLSHAEWVISDKAHREAYFSDEIEYSDLSFVYFIIHRGKVIYIGITKNPHIRENDHCKTLNEKRIFTYQIKFVGPFEYDLATKIEKAEIARRHNDKKLLNKTHKKQEYDKAFSIENYRQKAVSFFRKGSQIEKMVC